MINEARTAVTSIIAETEVPAPFLGNLHYPFLNAPSYGVLLVKLTKCLPSCTPLKRAIWAHLVSEGEIGKSYI